VRSIKFFYPKLWPIGLSILAIAGGAGAIFFSAAGPQPQPGLPLILVAISLTMTVATILLIRHDSQFITILGWGMYVSLLLFVISPYWVWELGEDYSVKPVASLVKIRTPARQEILTSHPYHRPSLNFYSDRVVRPASSKTLIEAWKQPDRPYLLVTQDVLQQLKLPNIQKLGQAGDWLVVTRQLSKASPQPLNQPSKKQR
jgi:hypothetical protein